MGFSVVHQRDLAIGHGMRVYRNGTHAAARACRVFYDDMVDRRAVAVGQLVPGQSGATQGSILRLSPRVRLADW